MVSTWQTHMLTEQNHIVNTNNKEHNTVYQQQSPTTTCKFIKEHFQTPSWPSNYSESASVYEQSTHKKEFSNCNRLSLLVVTNDEDSDYIDP